MSQASGKVINWSTKPLNSHPVSQHIWFQAGQVNAHRCHEPAGVVRYHRVCLYFCPTWVWFLPEHIWYTFNIIYAHSDSFTPHLRPLCPTFISIRRHLKVKRYAHFAACVNIQRALHFERIRSPHLYSFVRSTHYLCDIIHTHFCSFLFWTHYFSNLITTHFFDPQNGLRMRSNECFCEWDPLVMSYTPYVFEATCIKML